jgi:hypothetical protein
MTSKPDWWHAPWFLQAAHVGSGSGAMVRKDDIRMVVCLSPLLHELHIADCEKMPYKVIGSHKLPTIDNANMLWIKQHMDKGHWDFDFVCHCWKGNPPKARRPHKHWVESLENKQGIIL